MLCKMTMCRSRIFSWGRLEVGYVVDSPHAVFFRELQPIPYMGLLYIFLFLNMHKSKQICALLTNLGLGKSDPCVFLFNDMCLKFQNSD